MSPHRSKRCCTHRTSGTAPNLSSRRKCKLIMTMTLGFNLWPPFCIPKHTRGRFSVSSSSLNISKSQLSALLSSSDSCEDSRVLLNTMLPVEGRPPPRMMESFELRRDERMLVGPCCRIIKIEIESWETANGNLWHPTVSKAPIRSVATGSSVRISFI